MNMTWNLDSLYPSFESDKLKKDHRRMGQYIDELREWAAENLQSKGPSTALTVAFLTIHNSYKGVYISLMAYAELVLSADSSNTEAMNLLDEMERRTLRLPAFLRVLSAGWLLARTWTSLLAARHIFRSMSFT